MLKYQLILALRRFRKDRFFSVLNITGLTVGVCCFILLMLYVRYELSHDRFHQNSEEIYVLADEYNMRNGVMTSERFRTLFALALKEQIPELGGMTHLNSVGMDQLISFGDRAFYEDEVFATDNQFFEVFDFPLIAGTIQLDQPDKAVITQHMAEVHFKNENPIGRTLTIRDKGAYEITGIVTGPPPNSHIRFEVLISNHELLQEPQRELTENIARLTSGNYLRLPQGTDPDEVTAKAKAWLAANMPKKQMPRDAEGNTKLSFYLYSYTDIHLHSGFDWYIFPVSDITYVYVLGSVALLILIVASLNYINLTTARSSQKIKEIGLRKVMGADRRQVVRQLVLEAMLMTGVSVVIAFALAERLLPFFNNLVERELSLSYLSLEFLLFVCVFSLILGLFSGLYPALRLSGFSPVQSLTGYTAIREKKGLRRTLVFFQFFVAQALIVSTFIIQSQLHFLQNKDVGYDREELLYFNTYRELKDSTTPFKSQLEALPGIQSVSFSEGIMGRTDFISQRIDKVAGYEGERKFLQAHYFQADTAFLRTMGMELLYGIETGSEAWQGLTRPVYLSESAVAILGWDDPLGRVIPIRNESMTIAGVVSDFNNESLKAEIIPAVISIDPEANRYVSIKLNPGNTKASLEAIAEIWDRTVSDRPFEYQFYDDYYDYQYKSELRLGQIFNLFSSLAIIIAILGLLGLVAFAAEQRLKEFSIRKVLGARVRQLVLLLYREFLWLILLAFVVACPIAWYGLGGWLDEFAYKIEPGPFTFLLALALTLTVASLVVAQLSGKVSKLNPAETLKND